MPLTELIFPELAFTGGPQHLMCNAGDPAEFLATASAWLALRELPIASMGEEEAWSLAQTEHRQGLLNAQDPAWRQALSVRLSESLFEFERYRQWWNQLAVHEASWRIH